MCVGVTVYRCLYIGVIENASFRVYVCGCSIVCGLAVCKCVRPYSEYRLWYLLSERSSNLIQNYY